MSETNFIREVVRRTGCGLLLDVNNVAFRPPTRVTLRSPISPIFRLDMWARSISLGIPNKRTTREIFCSSTATMGRSRTRYGNSSNRDRPMRAYPDARRMGQRHPRVAAPQGGSRRRPGGPRALRARFHSRQSPCYPLKVGANSAASLPMRPSLPPRCSILTARHLLRSPGRTASPPRSATASIATTSRSVSSTLWGGVPGDNAHYRGGFLSGDGEVPCPRHAAHLAASVRIRPRLSRFH